MMGAVIIRLVGDPVGKGRPRFVRSTGVAFTPAKTRSYEAALRYAAQEAMGDRPLFEGPVRVVLVAAFAVPKSFSKAKRIDALTGAMFPTVKPDADNLIKNLDALNGVVFRDDKQVVWADIRKVYATKPELTIEVSPR